MLLPLPLIVPGQMASSWMLLMLMMLMRMLAVVGDGGVEVLMEMEIESSIALLAFDCERRDNYSV